MTAPYYSDEHVALYHGDCLELADVWTCADVLVTDPPYGRSWKQGNIKGHKRSNAHAGIANDDSTEVRDVALELWGSRPAIVFGDLMLAPPAHRLIWWKRGAAPGPAKCAFMLQDEEIYVIGKGWRESSPPMRTVLATNEFRSKQVVDIGHPTPKPIALMVQLIDRCPDGIIADPFAGSGSTLVAAKQLGRKAIGVELEERYCEIAARRLSQGVLDFGAAS